MEWENNVLAVFEKVGTVLEAERVYAVKLILPVGEQPEGYLRYEWKDTGEQNALTPKSAPIQSLVALHLDPWLVHLRKGEVVCTRKKDVGTGEILWNISPEMRTLILLPVHIGTEWWGYIGIESRDDREYSPAELEALRALAVMFATATQRKRLDEQLIGLKLGVERSHDVIFMTDREGFFTYINPAFSLLYGYDWPEVQGKAPRILKSGQQKAEFYHQFWETLIKGSVVSAEIVNKRKDGTLVNVSVVVTPIIDKAKQVTGFMAIQRDETQEKKYQTELLKKAEELERMNKLMVGRELKMIELKKEIEELKKGQLPTRS